MMNNKKPKLRLVQNNALNTELLQTPVDLDRFNQQFFEDALATYPNNTELAQHIVQFLSEVETDRQHIATNPTHELPAHLTVQAVSHILRLYNTDHAIDADYATQWFMAIALNYSNSSNKSA